MFNLAKAFFSHESTTPMVEEYYELRRIIPRKSTHSYPVDELPLEIPETRRNKSVEEEEVEPIDYLSAAAKLLTPTATTPSRSRQRNSMFGSLRRLTSPKYEQQEECYFLQHIEVPSTPLLYESESSSTDNLNSLFGRPRSDVRVRTSGEFDYFDFVAHAEYDASILPPSEVVRLI